VITYLTRASGGLTRRINLVADKALLAAFAEGTHNVTLRHVRAAVRDSEFSDLPRARSPRPFAYGLGGLAIGGVIGVTVFAAYQTLLVPAEPVSAPIASTQANAAATGVAAPASQAPDPAIAAATPGSERSATAVGPTAESRSRAARAPESIAAAAPFSGQGSPAVTGNQSAAASPPTPQPGLTEADFAAGGWDSAAGDVLEQRLRATEQWLAEQNGTVYSIQLLGTNDPELLREYFKTIGKYLEIEKVYVYRTMANQRPSLTVLYGNFTNWAEVNRMLQSLPEELKTNRPYYRTIQGVRSEIAKHRS
jgi:septal ring-binding cell division protein DamX